MKQTFKFKTNLNCQNCVNRVSPILDDNENISEWEVDFNHPEKTLTVETDVHSKERMIEDIKRLGFEIEEK